MSGCPFSHHVLLHQPLREMERRNKGTLVERQRAHCVPGGKSPVRDSANKKPRNDLLEDPMGHLRWSLIGVQKGRTIIVSDND
ncbi:hypothetical protein HAX54_021065, partial [Datura stramonium]|nr:hypothetical protein [Datura stramonium]